MVAEQVEFVDCCWTRLRTIQSAPLLNYRLYRQNTEEQSERIHPSLTCENKRPLVLEPVVAARNERDVPTRNSRIQHHVRRIHPLAVPLGEVRIIGKFREGDGAMDLVAGCIHIGLATLRYRVPSLHRRRQKRRAKVSLDPSAKR